MNTRTTPRQALTRLTAVLLCVICLLGLLPTSAFALSLGTKASSWFGDAYRASDGDSYYHQDADRSLRLAARRGAAHFRDQR